MASGQTGSPEEQEKLSKDKASVGSARTNGNGSDSGSRNRKMRRAPSPEQASRIGRKDDVQERDYATQQAAAAEDTRPLYERRAGLSAANRTDSSKSRSRSRDGRNRNRSPGAGPTPDAREESSSSSFILPGMSGIGLAAYGTSPAAAATMHAPPTLASATATTATTSSSSGGGLHFPRFGSSHSTAGTGSSAGTGGGSIGSHIRPLSSSSSRHRTSSNTRERASASPKIGGDSGSEGGSWFPNKPGSRPGTSSGTSGASGGSSWNFFRSSSNNQNQQPKHRHTDSFSSIRESPNEYLESPSANSSGAVTPIYATRSGLTTPIAMTGTGLNEAVSKRLRGTRLDERADIVRSASYTIMETVSASTSVDLGATSARRKGRKATASPAIPQSTSRKADNLVAMAAKSDNTHHSSRLAVAGRSLAKILHVKQGEDSGQREFAYDIVEETGFRVSLGSNKPQEAAVKDGYVTIEETLDLHASLLNSGFKGAKAMLINDIGWGYDYTANKVVTAHSNGTVALYDIEKSGSKFDGLRTPHPSGRGINVVSFGGPSGQGAFIASGCQDGDIAILDIRHANVITLSTPLDPVRSICFAPRHNTAAPSYHLIAASESGHVTRWDLRQPKHPLDRVMAHPGGALTLDWKGSVLDLSSFASDSGISDEKGGEFRKSQAEDSWGWLASAGMDGTVKIWDMSASNHTLRQVHTLNVARPVQFVRWHSSAERPCDVVVTPLPAASVPGQTEESWQPDIEIWDVRREYLAKETIWTGGAIVSCLSPYSDTQVLWALNRATSAFQQIDVRHEAVDPLGYCPKVATAWSPEGTVAFALGSGDVAPSYAEHPTPAEEPLPIAQTVGLVSGLDPDFDQTIFAFLSQQYRFRAKPPLSVADICLANAQVAMEVELYSVAKIWKLAADWVAKECSRDAAATPTGLQADKALHRKNSKGVSSPGRSSNVRRTRSQTSPSVPFQHLQRDRHASQKSSPLVTSQTLSEVDISPRALPSRLPQVGTTPRITDNADLVGSDTSHSNSAHDDTQDSATSGQSPAEADDASDEEDATTDIRSQARSAEIGSLSNPALSLSAILSKKRPALAALSRQNTHDGSSSAPMSLQLTSEQVLTPRASTPANPATRQMALPLTEASLGLGRPSTSMAPSLSMSRTNSGKTQTRFPSRKNSDESSISSSSSDRDTGKGSDSGHQTLEERRARAKKKLQQRTRTNGSKSRKSPRRRIVSNNDATGRGRQAASRSASNSKGRSTSKARLLQMQRRRDNFQTEAVTLLQEMTRQHLVQAVQDLADQGDVQTSATIAFLLRDQLKLSHTFFARITAAYLKLLRQLDCHVSSASIVKASELETVRQESQDNTLIRTACGNCERAIHNPPYGKCRKCAASTTYCSICHTVGTSLWTWCTTCGHGAHESCLYLYAAEMSIVPEGQEPLLDLDYFSRRSTPLHGMHTPIATAPSSPLWLFPAEQALFHATPASAPQSRTHSRPMSPELGLEAIETRTILLSQCPSGCGHSCLLTLPLTELAAAAAHEQE